MIQNSFGPSQNLSLRWKTAPTPPESLLAQGVGAIVYAGPFPVNDTDQLSFAVLVTGAAAPHVRLRWCNDPKETSANAYDECVDVSGLTPGQFTLAVKDWGPLAAGRYAIHRPADFFQVCVGIYTDNAPGAGDSVEVIINRGRTTPTQAIAGS